MELRCPDCVSPEVENDPAGKGEALRCDNCGARFPRDSALVTVLEAAAYRGKEPPPLFTFNPEVAAIELRNGDGAIRTVNPYSDADELHRLLDGAQAAKIVESTRARAGVYVYPMSIGEPDPLLAVDTGCGMTVLGFELKLRQDEGEDPIAFTVRFLREAVEEANGLTAGRVADSARLDRIAAFMNRPGQWNGGDVCELVARELHESGRRLLDE
jgi:hypothetical protein